MGRELSRVWRVGLGVLFLSAVAARAQIEALPTLSRGLSAESYDSSGFDSVNLFNLSNNLVIPIRSDQTDGGLRWGLTLTYSSNVWDFIYHRTDGVPVEQEVDCLEIPAEPGENQVTCAAPRAASNAGLGFFLGAGRLIPPGLSFNDGEGYLYQAADGSSHAFYASLLYGQTQNTAVCYSRDLSTIRLKGGPGDSNFNCKSNRPDDLAAVLEMPDGTLHTFTRADDTQVFELLRIEDQFGNGVDFARTTNQTTISDRYRTHTIVMETRPVSGSRVVDKIVVAKFGGGTAEWDFDYVEAWIDRSCKDDYHDVGAEVPVTLLNRITRPDGSTYEFGGVSGYHTACGVSDDLPGVLKAVTLPTGGRIEWTYQDMPFAAFDAPHNLGPASRSVGVATKRVLGADGLCYGVANPTAGNFTNCTWTYTRSLLTDSVIERWTKVRSPSQDESVYWFDQKGNRTAQGDGWQYGLPMSRTQADPLGGGRFLSEQHYDGTAQPANLKRSVYVAYARDNVALSTAELPQVWYDTNRRRTSQRTVFHDDGSRYAQTDWSLWNGLGNFGREETLGTFDSGNARTTTTSFVYSSSSLPGTDWLPNLYTSVEVLEPSPGDTARQEFVFNPENGFLECVRTLKAGVTRNQKDLLVRYYPTTDTTSQSRPGNLAREELYGGERQSSLGTGAGCGAGAAGALERTIDHTYAYGQRASSKIAGMTWNSLDLLIDENTGLASTSKDVAGVPTDFSYAYIPMSQGGGMRITEKPQPLGAVDADAWTETTISLPDWGQNHGFVIRKLRCSEASSGSCQNAGLPGEQLGLDEFGRPYYEHRYLPTLVAMRASRFDAEGRKRRITSWFDSSLPGFDPETSAGTVYSGFDPFGRPTAITLPDGSSTTISYAGVRETKTTQWVADSLTGSESQSCKKEVFDRQGRLFAVEEDSINCVTPGSRTQYSYDEGGRLTKVCQNGSGSNCSGGQAREFTYDNRGFLLSEKHPEKGGPSGHGTVSYTCHDASGDARFRDEGATPRRLGFVHDPADRLTQVYGTTTAITNCTGEMNGPLLKQFTYGTANSDSNLRKGKLQSAYRLNELTPPAFDLGTKAEVTETYTYQGRSGRVSKRVTELLGTNLPSETWEISQTYDSVGNVATQSYPVCTSGASCVGAPSSRALQFGSLRGMLDTIVDVSPGSATWLSNLVYHPSGMPASVEHGDGLVETIAQNAHGMGRPESITITHPNEPVSFATGTYLYDGSGNVKRIGADDFAYDRLHRLRKSRLDSLAGSPTQDYTFDLYGNLTTMTTNGVGVNFPVLGTTNRLSSSSYDESGNLLAWNGNDYVYDRFNMNTRWTNGGEAWQYVYTADDERLWSIREGPAGTEDTSHSNFTVRGLGNEVLLRDERRPGTTTGGGATACPSGAPATWLFCNGFETGSTGVWSTTTTGGRVSTDYIYRGAHLLAARTHDGTSRHFGLDHLGTPRVQQGDIGGFLARHTYFPFGQEVSSSQNAEVMKFTGHERDLQSTAANPADDLDSMHARRMSPIQGRFLSVDPILQIERAQRVPRLWNRYSYVIGNPLKFTDPSGAVLHSQQGINNASRIGAWIKERLFGNHPSRQDGPPADESAMTDEQLAEIGATRDMTSWLDEAQEVKEQGLEGATAEILASVAISGATLIGGIEAAGAVKALAAVGRRGSGLEVIEVIGGLDDAKTFFDFLRGSNAAIERRPGVLTARSTSGPIVTFRASSKSGPPTVDVHGLVSGIQKFKWVPK